MKVFVIGKSAKEHALIEKFSTSERITEIFCAPANPAIDQHATCVNIAMDDIISMVDFAKENQIDITIVLDEDLIKKGISNIFKEEGLKIFAPTQESAQIGTSRAFLKKFLYKQKIPITKYGVFDKENSALDFLKKSQFPVMIKFDYFTENDYFYCKTFNQAREILGNLFSDSQKKIIIEEYPEGEEFWITILTDGYHVLPLSYLKITDRKDKKENLIFKEENAYTPVSQITDATENEVAQKIIFPTIDALQNTGTPFEGFLSLKFLQKTNGEILAIEFLPTISNAQATCIFQLIEDDLFDILYTITEGAFEDCYPDIYLADFAVESQAILCEKRNSIANNIENIEDDNVELYYNDVGMNCHYNISTNGQKAFYLTARASTINRAKEIITENAAIIQFSENLCYN